MNIIKRVLQRDTKIAQNIKNQSHEVKCKHLNIMNLKKRKKTSLNLI